MKCYTRYMLPLVIAVCMFLGSLFISLDVHAQEKSTDGLGYESYFLACREEVQKVLDGRGYSLDNFYYYGFYDESSGYVKVYVTNGPLTYDSSNSYFFVSRYSVLYRFDISAESKVVNSSYNYYDFSAANLSLKCDSTSFSNYDVYYKGTDEIFFQGPSPFQQAVRGQDWTTVMTEIVIMLPLLIVFLVSLIGLRKGLRFVSSFLHRA